MRQAFSASMLVFLLAAPVAAAPWGADYHMGTFVAFGGDEEVGRISLECAHIPLDGSAAPPEGFEACIGG